MPAERIRRFCRRGLGWVIRIFVRRTFPIQLVAARDVEPDERMVNGWRATGPLPAFFLTSTSERLPVGWVHIVIEMDVLESDSARAWISCDCGEGFTDAGCFALPRPRNGRIDEFIRLPDEVRGLRFDPTKGECKLTIGCVQVREISLNEAYLRKMIRYCRGEGLSPMLAFRAAVVQARIFGIGGLISWVKGHMHGESPATAYGPWARDSDTLTGTDIEDLRRMSDELSWKPRFSILMPVYDTPVRWLKKAIESVRGQAYEDWELCICDNGSSDRRTVSLLAWYASIDPRIKVIRREINAHISAATNDAMDLATANYICLMDSDDVIPANALFEFAKVLNEDPGICFIYSDEDKISVDDMRYDPFFKPDWSPEFLESCNYTGHFAVYRIDLARKIGGFRSKFDGAQDYDFVLRYTEHVKSVRHIRKILYHWRALYGSVAAGIDRKAYTITRARQALEERVERGGRTGQVVEARVGGWFQVRRVITGTDFVSLILSSGGESSNSAATPLSATAEAIRSSSTYENLEFVFADGPLAEQLNSAAGRARGNILVFADSDVKVVTSDWLEAMLRCVLRPGVGVVGAKTLFADGTIKHAGLTFRNGLPHYIRLGFPQSDWGYWGSSGATRNCLAVSGACMMISKKVFHEVGGFDEAINAEYIDIDLCLRLWQGGLRCVFVPHAVLIQQGGERRVRRDGDAGAERFRTKWSHLTVRDPFYGANLNLDPPTFEFCPYRD